KPSPRTRWSSLCGITRTGDLRPCCSITSRRFILRGVRFCFWFQRQHARTKFDTIPTKSDTIPTMRFFVPHWSGFLSSSQDHALDQRVRDVGRMAQDGRPLVLRHELALPADEAVGQGPELIDQPDIVRARAKVERPLWHRSGWAAWGGRLIDRVGRIQPIPQLPAGLGAQVDE